MAHNHHPAAAAAWLAANDKLYMDAPINIWAAERKARDAADLDLFVATLEKVQQRQQRKEALAAAADVAPEAGPAAADSDDAKTQAIPPMDEIMGEGFTEFVNDGVGGVVFYDEDADFIDEDEDEDEEGEEEEEGEEGLTASASGD
jgi:hypothetical protein